MLNAPAISPVGNIKLPLPAKDTLSNGIPSYTFNGAHNNILKIDIVFDAGRWTEPAPLVADAVARLIKSGTKDESAFQLAEEIDFYGSSIKAEAGYNTFTITLVCVTRYLNESLISLRKCLADIIFPEDELELFKAKTISQLRVNLEKNEYLADMALKKALFGAGHPYGYDTTEPYIQQLDTATLRQYYSRWLRPENARIFIAGRFTDNEIQAIYNIIGDGDWGKQPLPSYPAYNIVPEAGTNIQINLPGSVQSSIAMGMPLFNRQHPDFGGMILLNTVFGGFFGSRLMQNIREEKGLTYGIYSELQTYKHAGLWLISTEIAVEHTDTCLQEIFHEGTRLKKELVPEEELEQARNYLLGKMLSRTDGPFNQSSTYRSLLIEGVDEEYFDRVSEEIRATDRYRIKQLAERYLHAENMCRVVVS